MAESNLSRRLSLVALLCCGVAFLVAVTGLLGYLPGMSLLGSVFPGYIPMAPSTAISFIFLSVILSIYRYRRITGILHVVCVLVVGIVSLFGLLKFGDHFNNPDSSFESMFVPVLDKLGDIPVGIMSYLTGLGIFIAGLGVLNYALRSKFKKEFRWVVGASGGFVTLFSFLMLFGYIYRQPFLYGQGSIVPMALTTTIAFLFLGVGIITANGPGQLFTRFFAGNSTRARLLRVFIPLTISIILIKDAIDSLIEANAATLMTSTLLLLIGVTSMVVYWISGVIGRRIDCAEDSVRKSEKRFRSVFNQAAVGVASLAPDGTWLSVNKKLCDIVGYSRNELLSKTFQDITHPDDLQTDLVYVHQLLEDEIQTYSIEKRYMKKSGDLVWINLTVSLVRDTNNDPDYFVSIIEDITERKHTEEALRESNENFQQVVSSVTSAVWKADICEDGSFENKYTSPVFNELLGLPPDGSTNAWDKHLSFIKPSYLGQVNAAFREAIESPGKVLNLDFEVLKDNGQTAWFNSKGRCFEKDGKLHIFGSTMDITESKKAEKALQESKDKLNLIINTSPIGICTVDPLGNFATTNFAYEQMLGYSKEEFRSLSFFDVTHPDDRPKNKKLFQSMFSLETTGFSIKKRYICKDGSEIDVDVHAIGIVDDEGEVRFGTAFVNDVTERKRAQEALRESEGKFRLLAENSVDLVWQMNLKLDFTYISPNVKEIFGYTEEEWTGSNLSKFSSKKEFLKMAQEAFKALKNYKTFKSISFEAVMLKKDGEEIPVEISGKILLNNIGLPVAIQGSTRDITERKKAEKVLRESEAKLNALFTSMTEMVVLHELVLNDAGEAIDYRISDCNEVFTEITGIRKEDAIGKLASEVYQTDPPPYLKKYAKVALGGDPQEFNTFHPPLDKHFMISVVSPQAGKFATITTDITAMMQIQEMIIAKNKEMENYLYVASHDLRTPLVNIQGFSQRLKNQADSIKVLLADNTLEPAMLHELDKITDEDIPNTLSFLLGNIKKMDSLINGLLKLSRTGTVAMNIQKIDMNALIARILQNLGFQINEAQCDIHIATLPGCYGDAALLDQLFTNVISNALKYSDSERALEISMDAEKIYNRVVYTIRDTGRGIAQKHLGKVWDVFYRVDPRSDRTGEGIGLSLVKRIVEKHKGKVWIESEENKGSVFHIELHNRSFTEF